MMDIKKQVKRKKWTTEVKSVEKVKIHPEVIFELNSERRMWIFFEEEVPQIKPRSKLLFSVHFPTCWSIGGPNKGLK